MKGKTRVVVIANTHQCMHEIGVKGYIDGYCRAADNRCYAIVISNGIIDYVPLYKLKALED